MKKLLIARDRGSKVYYLDLGRMLLSSSPNLKDGRAKVIFISSLTPGSPVLINVWTKDLGYRSILGSLEQITEIEVEP